jgi:formylglycine-generating enzyme required for sulfatase activity
METQSSQFTKVKIWEWKRDAKAITGGQEKTINPYLDNAHIAIFVLKTRIGAVTWEEMQRCRNREKFPLIALFPKNPPKSEILSTVEGALEWANLLQKKNELTRDWNNEASHSVTPVEEYSDLDYIRNIILEQVRRLLSSILKIQGSQKTRTTKELIEIKSEPELRIAYETTAKSRHPCKGATLEDLDWALVESFREKEIPSSSRELSKNDVIKKLGLFSPLVSDQCLHNAAVLCFCNNPHLYIQNAYADFIVGNPGERSFICKQVTGPLSSQIQKLVSLTLERLERISEFGNEGLRSEDTDVPSDVVREAISNAVAHRDYHLPGTVQVRVFDDHIDIQSPGSFPDETSWDLFLKAGMVSRPADTAIAFYLKRLLALEAIGRGFMVFRKYIDARGSYSIVWEQPTADTVLVRIRRYRVQPTINLRQNVPDTAASASIRDCYLEWLRHTCEGVELLGLDLKDSQNVRLGQVYVPAVTALKMDDKRNERMAEFGREQRHNLLLHRLGEESLYVPGGPGAGKSTFCRWLALAVASGFLPAHLVGTPEGFEEQLPEDLRVRFPLLCRLREWTGHSACLAGNGHWTAAELEAALACWLAAAKPGGLTPEVWWEEMAHGRCLLILDGVDEVPETLDHHRPRRNLISGLTDALPEWLKAGNRVLLTSRPYGLDDADRRGINLPQAELAELPQPLQETFIRRWYAAANPPRAEEKASGLIAHLGGRSDLAGLRANPMLLTALCVKYDEGQRLPQDFYRLYDSVVNQVLHKRYLTENERDRARLRLSAVALGMHQGITKWRTTPAPEVGIDEVDRILAALADSDWTTEGGGADAASRREDLLSNSGLLLPRAERRAGFYHLSFQEFLAAVRLRRVGASAPDQLKRYAATPEWRRTLTFLFCAIADQDSPENAVAGYDSLRQQLEPESLVADPNPALLLADCLEVAHARGWNLMRFADPLRRACKHALEHLKPPERDYLWRTLGRLGFDDRPGVGLGSDGLPDIRWVRIPGAHTVRASGQFPGFTGLCLGNGAKPDPEAGDEENWPADTLPLDIAGFELAAYPVTVAQFKPFVKQDGYREAHYWSEDGWRWLAKPNHLEPGWWNDPFWTVPNQPVIGVSWYEAEAYCHWLNEQMHEPLGTFRLPTEAEWEWAARGPEGRRYPWGDEWEAWRCNSFESHLNRISAVGCFPGGAADWWRVMTGSDGQAHDLAGNVWEWMASAYTEDYSRSSPSVMNADSGGGPRVLRGGSWGMAPERLRSSARLRFLPRNRLNYVGFRLARTLTI